MFLFANIIGLTDNFRFNDRKTNAFIQFGSVVIILGYMKSYRLAIFISYRMYRPKQQLSAEAIVLILGSNDQIVDLISVTGDRTYELAVFYKQTDIAALISYLRYIAQEVVRLYIKCSSHFAETIVVYPLIFFIVHHIERNA